MKNRDGVAFLVEYTLAQQYYLDGKRNYKSFVDKILGRKDIFLQMVPYIIDALGKTRWNSLLTSINFFEFLSIIIRHFVEK